METGNLTEIILPGNWTLVDSQNVSNVSEALDDGAYVDDNGDYRNLMSTIQNVQHVLGPTLCVVGLICNSLTIYTMADKRVKQANIQIMLISLALTDTLALFIAFFNQQVAQDLFGRDVRGDSNVGCKIFIVFYRTGKVMSSWIVVFVAIERFIAVVFPLRVKALVNRKTSITTLSLVFVGVLAFNAAWSFSSEVVGNFCIPSLRNPDTERLHYVFNIIRGIQYSFLPIVILMSVTPPIIYKLIQSHRRRGAMAANSSLSTTDLTRTTLMLTVVVLLHVVSSIPMTLYFIQEVVYGESIFVTTRTDYVIVYRLQPTMEGINHSSNFLIYILFSRQFRHRLREKLRCVCNVCAYLSYFPRLRSLRGSTDTPTV